MKTKIVYIIRRLNSRGEVETFTEKPSVGFRSGKISIKDGASRFYIHEYADVGELFAGGDDRVYQPSAQLRGNEYLVPVIVRVKKARRFKIKSACPDPEHIVQERIVEVP